VAANNEPRNEQLRGHFCRLRLLPRRALPYGRHASHGATTMTSVPRIRGEGSLLPTPQTLYRVCELHLEELRTDFQHRRLLASCDNVDVPLVSFAGVSADIVARVTARSTMARAYWRGLRNRISGSSLVLRK
jgi:hypothetical protein